MLFNKIQETLKELDIIVDSKTSNELIEELRLKHNIHIIIDFNKLYIGSYYNLVSEIKIEAIKNIDYNKCLELTLLESIKSINNIIIPPRKELKHDFIFSLLINNNRNGESKYSYEDWVEVSLKSNKCHNYILERYNAITLDSFNFKHLDNTLFKDDVISLGLKYPNYEAIITNQLTLSPQLLAYIFIDFMTTHCSDISIKFLDAPIVALY